MKIAAKARTKKLPWPADVGPMRDYLIGQGLLPVSRTARISIVVAGFRIFSGFEEAEAADAAFYASLSPRERVEILLDLVQKQQESTLEAPKGFERVYRVTELVRG